LSETEDKIAYARQFYNDVVTTYNTIREVFPSSIIAGMFNFQEAQLYEAEEAARESLKLQF
jgi:LemA protein